MKTIVFLLSPLLMQPISHSRSVNTLAAAVRLFFLLQFEAKTIKPARRREREREREEEGEAIKRMCKKLSLFFCLMAGSVLPWDRA